MSTSAMLRTCGLILRVPSETGNSPAKSAENAPGGHNRLCDRPLASASIFKRHQLTLSELSPDR